MLQGCEALICMPVTTPQIKVDSVRRLGGTVQLHGESYTETQTYAWVRRYHSLAHSKVSWHGSILFTAACYLLLVTSCTASAYPKHTALFMPCAATPQDRARSEGRVFIAPYDDPYTIAGQGTVGQEILRQVGCTSSTCLHRILHHNDLEDHRTINTRMLSRLQVHDPAAVSAIFVPVGGGGLVAGIAAYVKAIEPSIKIIGVEPSGAQ